MVTMAQSNQPFKRPNLSENEEYTRIPPPVGQESSNFKVPNKVLPPHASPIGIQQANQIPSPPMPVSQEEINWAIQLEEMVQKKSYKPTDSEMARYQDIANRIAYFQQNPQPQRQASQPVQQVVVVKKRNKFLTFLKIVFWITFAIFFFAKVSIIVLEPSYFTPRGKIYFVLKPELFKNTYLSLNMDKIYDDKIKRGFDKNDLNIPKSSKKIDPDWYKDPQYWEENYLLSVPYPNLSFLNANSVIKK